jgi:hypothetical protein
VISNKNKIHEDKIRDLQNALKNINATTLKLIDESRDTLVIDEEDPSIATVVLLDLIAKRREAEYSISRNLTKLNISEEADFSLIESNYTHNIETYQNAILLLQGDKKTSFYLNLISTNIISKQDDYMALKLFVFLFFISIISLIVLDSIYSNYQLYKQKNNS